MTVLLLAGTGEARQIATALGEMRIPAIASLAGITRQPEPLAIPTRHGGFGGADPFRAFLRDNQISAVLDATHPFAARISLRTAAICQEARIAYCQVLRPAWQAEPGDLWTLLDHEADVAAHVGAQDVVFLATGRQTLARFANLRCRRMICRQIDPPDRPFPFENGEFLVGRPPFSVADEVALFQSLGVTWLVVKNAGGTASRTKLTAARQIGLRVAMIRRPRQPDAHRVASVEAALDWVRAAL